MIEEASHQGDKLRIELRDHAHADENQLSNGDLAELDALIVGAGFAGVFMLKTLRDRGYRVRIFEAGGDTGGTWRWNSYPGAGVDSEVPEYEFSWPEVWKTWNWESNYPDYRELRAYFDHVDKIVGIKKDCSFNTVVTGAEFDTDEGRWTVRTLDGRETRAKFLVLGTGFSAKRYVPEWPGMNSFEGVIHHSSFWPDEDVPVEDKRCAVIGTGASGVQMVQAWGPRAGQLKVFQRTPNLAIPMRRRRLTAEEQEAAKPLYPRLFEFREKSFAGFLYDWKEKNTLDDGPEQRRAAYETAWATGGFRFWVAVYKDNLMSPEANAESYRFWLEKTRARIHDERLRELLAPAEMPHYFGIKRPCLEHSYYEQFNRPSVHLVDVNDDPIERFTETGITLRSGEHHELDVVAVATGFDVVTGAMTQLGLKSIDGQRLDEQWAKGASTYLGVTVSGYPNMFHMYGAHGPTLLSNGPSCVEVQGRWIADCIDKVQRGGIKSINPRPEAARAWKDRLVQVNDATLFPHARSTYMGGNVPGKVFEPVCFAGGIPAYASTLRAALDAMDGFELEHD